MFDTLVESSREKPPRHTGRYLLITSLIYGIALVALSALAVISFNPTLADKIFLTSKLPPLPLLPSDPGKAQMYPRKEALDQTMIYRQPEKLPDADLRKTDVAGLESRTLVTVGSGTPPLSGSRLQSNWATDVTGIPAPPAPQPKPPAKNEPVPEAKPQAAISGLNKVPEVVLQGMAIKKVNPIYPMVAKQVHAGGPVLVLVTIGEDGRVVEANIVSGHRLLRSAVLDAARQWVFTPTTVSGVPVRVQGILTFNFILQ
jgi:TonB family protein